MFPQPLRFPGNPGRPLRVQLPNSIKYCKSFLNPYGKAVSVPVLLFGLHPSLLTTTPVLRSTTVNIVRHQVLSTTDRPTRITTYFITSHLKTNFHHYVSSLVILDREQKDGWVGHWNLSSIRERSQRGRYFNSLTYFNKDFRNERLPPVLPLRSMTY